MGENGTRISKALQAFNQLGGIWKTNVVSADKKVKICNCTIKRVLLKPGKLTKRQRRNCKPSKTSHKGRTSRNYSKTKEAELDWTYVKKGK
jgi:hypothetical protein